MNEEVCDVNIPPKDLHWYQHVYEPDLNEKIMATNPGAWDSGQLPNGNRQGGAPQGWSSGGSRGEPLRPFSAMSYPHQIGGIGTITNGLMEQQMSNPPNSYHPAYQQYPNSSNQTPPIQGNQFTSMPSTQASNIDISKNSSSFTNPSSLRTGPVNPTSTKNHSHLLRILADSQPNNCPQDMRIFQVPQQNRRQSSHGRNSQEQVVTSGVSLGNTEWSRNYTAPPSSQNIYFSQQGYPEDRNHTPAQSQGSNFVGGNMVSHGMRQCQVPNQPRMPRMPYPSCNSSQQRPPQQYRRNMSSQQQTQSTITPQGQPRFRPIENLQNMLNSVPVSSMPEHLRSLTWQFFQEKSSAIVKNIPSGAKFGYFVHCWQLYDHYLKSFAVIHPSGCPASFQEFGETYLNRLEEMGTFRNYPSPSTSASPAKDEEPSDKSILGHWYRLPEEKQEQVTTLRLVNQTESTLSNVITDSVSQTNDNTVTSKHCEPSIPATSPTDTAVNLRGTDIAISPANTAENLADTYSDISPASTSPNSGVNLTKTYTAISPPESPVNLTNRVDIGSQADNLITNTNKDLASIKVEANESWENDQNQSPERESEDSVGLNSDESDEAVTGKKGNKKLTVKLPFHPPLHAKQKKKSASVDQKLKLSDKSLKTLSDVLHKVLMENKNVAESNSMAASILEIEPTAKLSEMEAESSPDHASQTVNKEGPCSKQSTKTSEPSVDLVGGPENGVVNELGQSYSKNAETNEETINVNKRKRFPTEVDSERRADQPSKKLRKEADKEDIDLPQQSEDPVIFKQPSAACQAVEDQSVSIRNSIESSMDESESSPNSESIINSEKVIDKKSKGQQTGGMNSETENPLQKNSCVYLETRLLFPIRFHGEKVLCINCENGQYLLMKEILNKNFVSLAENSSGKSKKSVRSKYFTAVFLAKERDLKILYKELPEVLKPKVREYMNRSENLSKIGQGKHVGIIHISDAHRLYQYFFGLKNCGDKCIQTLQSAEENISSQENLDKSSSEGETFENFTGNVYSDIAKQKSNVSMGYESDATIPYMEESDVTESNDDVDDVIILDDFSSTDTADEFSASEEIKTEQIDAVENCQDNVVSETNQKLVQVDNLKENVPSGQMKDMNEARACGVKSDDVIPQNTKMGEMDDDAETGKDIADDEAETRVDNVDDEAALQIDIVDDEAVDRIEIVDDDAETGKDNVDDESGLEANECQMPLKGGLAPLFGGHFRFLVIDGIKFYPLADLCKRFDVQDLIECMQLKKDNKYKALKCDWMDANFLNRLEPSFPDMIENSTLLEEKILFDVAHKKGIDVIYNLTEDVDGPEECSQPVDMSPSLNSGSNLNDENKLATAETIPSSFNKGKEDAQDHSNSMEENLIGKIPIIDGRETEKFFVDEEENERDSTECQVSEEPHTPAHHTPNSMGNTDLHSPNHVSSNIPTPVSTEKKQIQRNLSQDFTAVEVQQKK